MAIKDNHGGLFGSIFSYVRKIKGAFHLFAFIAALSVIFFLNGAELISRTVRDIIALSVMLLHFVIVIFAQNNDKGKKK